METSTRFVSFSPVPFACPSCCRQSCEAWYSSLPLFYSGTLTRHAEMRVRLGQTDGLSSASPGQSSGKSNTSGHCSPVCPPPSRPRHSVSPSRKGICLLAHVSHRGVEPRRGSPLSNTRNDDPAGVLCEVIPRELVFKKCAVCAASSCQFSPFRSTRQATDVRHS